MWCCGRAASTLDSFTPAPSISACRPRCSSPSAASPWRRTSKPSSSLDLPGTKVIVGDGPARAALEEAYPDAIFLGEKHGEELADIYAAADVFVFPSKTDTFGLVLLEALASGLPVAAFPVKGPRDVIGDAPVGALDHDLRNACFAALDVSRQDCVAFASNYTWEASARAFVDSIAAVGAVLPGRNGAEQPRFVA